MLAVLICYHSCHTYSHKRATITTLIHGPKTPWYLPCQHSCGTPASVSVKNKILFADF